MSLYLKVEIYEEDFDEYLDDYLPEDLFFATLKRKARHGGQLYLDDLKKLQIDTPIVLHQTVPFESKDKAVFKGLTEDGEYFFVQDERGWQKYMCFEFGVAPLDDRWKQHKWITGLGHHPEILLPCDSILRKKR